MASITNNHALFFVTSPRTPDKMLNEVRFLVEHFSGRQWNAQTQTEYYLGLSKQNFFTGTANGDVSFKARDRINRSPKALGLVDLYPVVALTDAGKQYLYGPRPHEIFTKQLLKFQLYSPYHTDNNEKFNVRPYLELIRLIRDAGGLTKAEIALFAMQLIDYKNYADVYDKIIAFRARTKTRDKNISYRAYISQAFETELRDVYAADIAANKIATRESTEKTVAHFLTKKKGNHNDYADAAIRYLRATLLFSLNPFKNKIYVSEDKVEDVDFICNTIAREPYAYTSEDDYKTYLFSTSNIALLTDNKDLLLAKIKAIDEHSAIASQDKDVETLKDVYETLLGNKLDTKLKHEIVELRTYEQYDDVVDIYAKIGSKEIVEPPLFLEWNTWRAFTMLDDGDITGNFRVDDEGLPLYTAAGNLPDIECHYKDFTVIVEVTMSSGQKQYEMEGEPVPRHLGTMKRSTEQEVYCIFIAPHLSPATVAYYYSLHQIAIAHYGGKAKIIPLQLDVFMGMLKNAKQAATKPTSRDLQNFLETAAAHVATSADEIEWLQHVNLAASKAFN